MINSSYQFSEVFNSNVSLTLNRFSNPQGSINTALSMNMGIQKKLLNKKLVISLNVVDPFKQLQNRFFTYGTNFTLESVNSPQTKDFRIALAYTLSKTQKKNKLTELLKKSKTPKN